MPTHQILIIGGGRIGQALSRLLAKHPDTAVIIWDIKKELCSNTRPIGPLVKEAGIIIHAAPTSGLAANLGSIARQAAPGTAVICLSKGLDTETGQTSAQLMADILPQQIPYALIGGGLLAESLHEPPFGTVIVASKHRPILALLQELLGPLGLNFEFTTDIQGVALASVLKNIYAILLGMCDALELGSNIRGLVVTQAIREMQVIGKQLGAKDPDTFIGIAGLGDLITTGFSHASANNTTGRNLVDHPNTPCHSEGALALPHLIGNLKTVRGQLPALFAIQRIIEDKSDPATSIKRLIIGL